MNKNTLERQHDKVLALQEREGGGGGRERERDGYRDGRVREGTLRPLDDLTHPAPTSQWLPLLIRKTSPLPRRSPRRYSEASS
jgi:hypothetical protein